MHPAASTSHGELRAPIPWSSLFVGLCELKQGVKILGMNRLQRIARADPMVYTKAVQERFQYLLANDPGGPCHCAQLLKVAQREIRKWEQSAQPPAPQRQRQRLKIKMHLAPHPRFRSAGFPQPQPAMAGSEPSGLAGGPHESLRPEVPAQRASASVSLEAPLAQAEEPPATQQAGARGPATASTSVPHTARPVQGQKGRRAQASKRGSVEDSTARGCKRTILQGGAMASTRNLVPASVAKVRKCKPSQLNRPAQELQCECSGNCCIPFHSPHCPGGKGRGGCPNPATHMPGEKKPLCIMCRCSVAGYPLCRRRGDVCNKHAREGAKGTAGLAGWKDLLSKIHVCMHIHIHTHIYAYTYACTYAYP